LIRIPARHPGCFNSNFSTPQLLIFSTPQLLIFSTSQPLNLSNTTPAI
jgi:hypothetical protein